MTDQLEEAEALIVSGLETVEGQWGVDHERTREARAAAKLLYETWSRPDKAAAY